MKSKKLLSLVLTTVITVSSVVPAYANNNADTALPQSFVALTSYAITSLRGKTDTTSHYVYNKSSFAVYVHSLDANNHDHTVNGVATVPAGKERFVRNNIYEHKKYECKLKLSTTRMSDHGTLKGWWSPDSVGSYPYAN